jgi:hypothetical protein
VPPNSVIPARRASPPAPRDATAFPTPPSPSLASPIPSLALSLVKLMAVACIPVRCRWKERRSAPPPHRVLPTPRQYRLPLSLRGCLPTRPSPPDPTRSATATHPLAPASAQHVEDPARTMACRRRLSYPDVNALLKTTRLGSIVSSSFSFSYTGCVNVA